MPASNGVFGASGALSRADRYFAIFAAWLALKDFWEAPPAAKPQIVRCKWWTAATVNDRKSMRTLLLKEQKKEKICLKSVAKNPKFLLND